MSELRFLEGPTSRVEVGIGPTQKVYHIHKKLICRWSQYFQAVFNGYFQEAASQVVTLEEEQPKLFDLVNYWLYSSAIRIPSEAKRPREIQSILVELWLFGDRRGMPALQNHTLDALHQSVIDLWDFGDAILIGPLFERSPEDAKIRDWLVEAFATFGSAKRLDKYLNNVRNTGERWPSPSFLFKLARRLIDVAEDGPRSLDYRSAIERMDVCRFHEHEGDENCRTLAQAEQERAKSNMAKGVKRPAEGSHSEHMRGGAKGIKREST